MSHIPSTKTSPPPFTSFKQQARLKHQAPATPELDRDIHPRYNRIQGYSSNGIAIDRSKGPLMGQRNSAAETLQGEQHKYPGDRSSRNCRIMVPDPRTSIKKKSNKLQATSFKQQATSIKRQARSFKLKATSNKLQDSRA